MKSSNAAKGFGIAERVDDKNETITGTFLNLAPHGFCKCDRSVNHIDLKTRCPFRRKRKV